MAEGRPERLRVVLIAIIFVEILVLVFVAKSVYNSPVSEEKLCVGGGGEWKEFPDSCVDLCDFSDNMNSTLCAQVLSYGCDCGENSCWNGRACV